VLFDAPLQACSMLRQLNAMRYICSSRSCWHCFAGSLSVPKPGLGTGAGSKIIFDQSNFHQSQFICGRLRKLPLTFTKSDLLHIFCGVSEKKGTFTDIKLLFNGKASFR
jgi:hypothetical protein